MLISCEKCSTTYVLDDGLIPPGGAPVQCTRCGNIFTAKPVSELTPPPASAMKGAGLAREPPSQVAAPASHTMMFGAAPPGGEAPPAASRAPASQTMMFGAARGGAAPPAAVSRASAVPPTEPAPARPASHTMMFGAAPTPSLQSAPSRAASPTMVFGAAAGAPGPSPVGSQTMVFGTAASNAAAATAQATAPVSASKPNQTMAFGSGAKAPSPAFGPPPTAAPSGRTAQAPAKPVATTAMFGAVTPAAGGGPQKQVTSTMMFGKPPEAPSVPDLSLNKTMGFGAPAGAPPPSTVGTSTMMFGAVETPTANVAAQVAESTVRVDLDAMMRAHAPGRETAPLDKYNRTQLFAMSDAKQAKSTDAPPSGAPHLDQTQRFSMNSGGQPEGGARGARNDATLPPNASMRQTVVGATDSSVNELHMTPEGSTTAPNSLPASLGSHDAGGSSDESSEVPFDAPPEESTEVTSQEASAAEESVEQSEEAFAAIESSTRRRNTIAVAVLLIAVLAAGGAVVWQLVLRQVVVQEKTPKVAPK